MTDDEQHTIYNLIGLPKSEASDLIDYIFAEIEKNNANIITIIQAVKTKYIPGHCSRKAFYAGYVMGRIIEKIAQNTDMVFARTGPR